MEKSKPRRRRGRKKPERRKPIPKLPRNQLQVIKNIEKDVGGWSQSYERAPKGVSIGWWPHPFKALFLGGCGRGKTNMIKNAFLQHQSTARPFKQLYVITCSPLCREYDDLEYTGLMTEIPDADFFDPAEKTAVILDDWEQMNMSSEQKRRLSTLFRYVATHRNVSVFCGFQSFFDVIPLIRKVSDIFVVYKPNNKLEYSNLANRLNIDVDDLRRIFKEVCNGKYDCLCVNNIPGAKYRLAKNLHIPIVVNEDSDQSDSSS
jgi:hypothetical protein